LEIIKEFKPDLIHIHGSEDFYGQIAKDTSIPILLSIQGILTVIEKGYYGEFTFFDKLIDTISINFIKGTSTIHNQLKMRKSACREREIIKTCRYFTGRTEFDRNFVTLINRYSNYYHCDRILRPPFYSAEWPPAALDLHTIYCTTSPAPYKGLDCLLDACNILKKNGFPNIRLRVGGPIQNSGIWDYIKRKVKALGLTQEVFWLGKLTSELIISELRQTSVYVLPSYVENSPNTLGEAMLVGVPCVASYVGGVTSMIIHGKDGLLFPSGDSYSLAGMIAKILRDPILARTLSKNAKTTARKRHDPQIIAQTMVHIYSEIIDKHSKENR
jgi:glycosyltransferase involved in cell wall biosynthesis